MVKKSSIFVFLTFVIFLSVNIFAFDSESKGKIIVSIDGFRNDKGEVFAGLFNSGKGFPDKGVYKGLKVKIENKKAEVIFENIPFGEYAVSVYQDENLNGKMDENWIGVPKEGVGFSNNAKGFLSAPGYKDAKFKLDKEIVTLEIKMQYF